MGLGFRSRINLFAMSPCALTNHVNRLGLTFAILFVAGWQID